MAAIPFAASEYAKRRNELSAYWEHAKMANANSSVKEFLNWLEKTAPEIAQQVKAEHFAVGRRTITPLAIVRSTAPFGLGQNESSEPTIWDRITETVEKLLPAYAQYRQQRELIKLNIERAKQGLPPLEAEQLAPQVRVGLTSDTQNMLMLGIVGLVGIGLVVALTRRR